MSSHVTGVSTDQSTVNTPVALSPTLRRRNAIETWIFLLPAIAFHLTWGWYPLVMGFIISLTDGQMIHTPEFVGFSNYVRMLTTDPLVMSSLRISISFSLLSILLTFVTPILIAIFIMEMPKKVVYIMMFVWFLPLDGITGIILWRYFYNEKYGILNAFVTNVLHLPAHNFLGDPNQVLFWLVFPAILMFGPGLLYMATLQGIPTSYFEAAEVEGASFWRKIWTITLPRLRPVIFLSMLFAVVGLLTPFDQMKLLTNGGPQGATLSVMLYIYNLISNYRWADASALSGIVFFISIGLLALFRVLFKEDPDA